MDNTNLLDKNWKPPKERMRDSAGRYRTQSLFLEIGYDTEFAVYSLKDTHFEYQGVVYPSLKQLYLEHNDPVEYDFANTYFTSYPHWLRITESKLFKQDIEAWRVELELKLRSQAVRGMLTQSKKGSYQAIKWLADRGWDNRAAGRPTKEEMEEQKVIVAHVASEFEEDIARLRVVS